MLCVDEVVNIDIDCPVNISNGEYACAKVSNVRLDFGGLAPMIQDILGELVTEDEDGSLDRIATPLSKLDNKIPGLGKLTKGVSILSFII
jgi:hypothetical protein